MNAAERKAAQKRVEEQRRKAQQKVKAAQARAAAKKAAKKSPSAADNFVNTYKKTKVGPIQRKISEFFGGINLKADYTNPNSTTAKMTTKAKANRAKSQGGATAAQMATAAKKTKAAKAAKKSSMDTAAAKRKITKAEAREKKLQADSKRAKSQAAADKIASKDTNMKLKQGKNYNVGVSKGGVSFKEAFAHFRKKGAKTFTWNGKKYTTELAKKKK